MFWVSLQVVNASPGLENNLVHTCIVQPRAACISQDSLTVFSSRVTPAPDCTGLLELLLCVPLHSSCVHAVLI